MMWSLPGLGWGERTGSWEVKEFLGVTALLGEPGFRSPLPPWGCMSQNGAPEALCGDTAHPWFLQY